MTTNYTQDAKQRCFDLIDKDIEEIWKGIAQMPGDTDRDKWGKKIKAIAEEYMFSSRFALIRIFQNRASESQMIDTTDPSRGFVVGLPDGTECRIEGISLEHARNMTSAEVAQFKALLLNEAGRQKGFDPSVDSWIIEKALSPVQKRTSLLTREEAFLLGHCLQFTLQEMEWFLLRVFDNEDGFSYNSSGDLIEAYGFLSGISADAVSKIKDDYEKAYGAVKKADVDEKATDWTRDTGSSLLGLVSSWSSYNRDNQDKMFLEWLGNLAPYLDLPSKTALRIYRNLAVYAYNLSTWEELPPDVDAPDVDAEKDSTDGRKETDFVRCLREIVQMDGYDEITIAALFESGRFSLEKCQAIADELLTSNKMVAEAEHPDKAKAFHVPQVLANGKITVNAWFNESRTRVRDILYGENVRIEKCDLLYLLWFLSNLCWAWAGHNPTPTDITNRINDFIHASENCLSAAMLPGFYPPHLIEQSMMLSIVYAFSGPEQDDPAAVYETICASLTIHRAKHTNKKKDATGKQTTRKKTTKKTTDGKGDNVRCTKKRQ